MKTHQLHSVEQQQISLESAHSLADLHKKIKSAPMFLIGSEQKSNFFNIITIGNKMPLMFDKFDLCFCSECESKWDIDVASCTNPDCLNCDLYDNPYDFETAFA